MNKYQYFTFGSGQPFMHFHVEFQYPNNSLKDFIMKDSCTKMRRYFGSCWAMQYSNEPEFSTCILVVQVDKHGNEVFEVMCKQNAHKLPPEG